MSQTKFTGQTKNREVRLRSSSQQLEVQQAKQRKFYNSELKKVTDKIHIQQNRVIELEQVHNSFLNFKNDVKGKIKDIYLLILKNKNNEIL